MGQVTSIFAIFTVFVISQHCEEEKMMRAITIATTGPSSVLEIVSKEIPKIGAGDLLVKNMYAGVNFIDTYHRSGVYPLRSNCLGMEGAGEVVAVGESVSAVKPGDIVAWPGTINSYAEFVAVPHKKAVVVPSGVDVKTGCAAMLQGMTAHYLVTSVYAIKPNDWALVHAAAGGVGQLLVQVIKSRGGKVIGTCGTEEKAVIAREAGCDQVIVGYGEFAKAAKDFTEGKGVHVVYDGVGKDTFTGSLDSLRPRGMMALYGGASGQVPPFDLQGLNSRGSLVVTRPKLNDFIADDEEFQWRAREIFAECLAGKLKFSIGAVYPAEKVADAHDDLEGRKTTGKLLLQF
jgi:NADPH:quinone reductase